MSLITINKGIFKHLQDFHSSKKEKVSSSRQVKSYRLKNLERIAQLLSSQNGVNSIIFTYAENTKGPNCVSGIAFGDKAKKILASQQAIEFSMYFRKSFSQKNETSSDVNGSEPEPIHNVQEQCNSDKATASIVPSGIQENGESPSEIDLVASIIKNLIHEVNASKPKKATKIDSGTSPNSSKSCPFLELNGKKHLQRKTVQNKAVNHNTVQGKAVKLAGKRKNTNKVLKKNPIEPNVTSLTMNEDFPGKKKACSSEIAVHACPKSDNKENEGSNSSEIYVGAPSNNFGSTHGMLISKQKKATSAECLSSQINGNKHTGSKTADKKSPSQKLDKRVKGKACCEKGYPDTMLKTFDADEDFQNTDRNCFIIRDALTVVEPIQKKSRTSEIVECGELKIQGGNRTGYANPKLTTFDANDDYHGTEQNCFVIRDALTVVEPIQKNSRLSEIVECVALKSQGEYIAGTKIPKPNWITEIDNESDSESLSHPLSQLSGRKKFKHVMQQKNRSKSISPKADEDAEIIPVMMEINTNDLMVSSNDLPTKKRFKLI